MSLDRYSGSIKRLKLSIPDDNNSEDVGDSLHFQAFAGCRFRNGVEHTLSKAQHAANFHFPAVAQVGWKHGSHFVYWEATRPVLLP